MRPTRQEFERALESKEFRFRSDELYDYMINTELQSTTIRKFVDMAYKQLNIINTATSLLSNLSYGVQTLTINCEPPIEDSKLVKTILRAIQQRCIEMLSYFDECINDDCGFGDSRIDDEYYKNAHMMEESEWRLLQVQGCSCECDGNNSIEHNEIVIAPLDFSNNNLELRYNNLVSIFNYRWRTEVLSFIPPSALIDGLKGELNSSFIDTAYSALTGASVKADPIIKDTQDAVMNEILYAFLLTRVKVSNKVCRDIYETLHMFGFIPKEIIESHSTRFGSNYTIRESYIRQKLFRIIESSPLLSFVYQRPYKERPLPDN